MATSKMNAPIRQHDQLETLLVESANQWASIGDVDDNLNRMKAASVVLVV